MRLNTLKPAEGSKQNRTRVGRGIGSGLGKTAGRGHKGQKSRSGGFHKIGFEGGQMPIYMRLPKRGFTARNSKNHAWLNLGLLSKAIEAGTLDAKKEITEEILVSSGVIRRVKDGVRLLAKGEAPKKVKITVTGASKAAVEAIEKAGGTVTLTGPVRTEKAD